MSEQLVKLANKLDRLGRFKEANKIDEILKSMAEQGWWEKLKAGPESWFKKECKCPCNKCNEARLKMKDVGGMARVTIQNLHCHVANTGCGV